MIRDFYIDQIFSKETSERVKIIVGMRRCGKTYLLRSAAELLSERYDTMITFDLESPSNNIGEDVYVLYDKISRSISPGGRSLVILDEAHFLHRSDDILPAIASDLRCEIVATLSGNFNLSDKLRELCVKIDMMTLSFNEMSSIYRDIRDDVSEMDILRDMLRFGSLPGAAVMSDEPECAIDSYISDVWRSIALKDMISACNLRDPQLLDRTARYYAQNLGHIVSAKSAADHIKMSGIKLSTETIYTYTDALESAGVIFRIPRFDIRSGRKLDTAGKIFFADIAMIYALIGEHNIDDGLIENAAALELLRQGWSLLAAQKGSKTIGIMAIKGEEIVYIRVAKDLSSERYNAMISDMISIKDNHKKIIISYDDADKTEYLSRSGVYHISLLDLLSHRYQI